MDYDLHDDDGDGDTDVDAIPGQLRYLSYRSRWLSVNSNCFEEQLGRLLSSIPKLWVRSILSTKLGIYPRTYPALRF